MAKATGKRKRKAQKVPKYWATLEYQLTEVLSRHCGERGYSEGAVETLERLINERDRAFSYISQKVLHDFSTRGHVWN